MPIGKLISGLFSDGTSKLIDSVSGAVDKFVFSKEERAAIDADLQKEINRHMEAMSAAAAQIEQAYLQDVANARAMQVTALNQTDIFSKRFVYYLATGVILLTFGYDFALLFIHYPEANRDLINMVAGVLNTTCLATIIAFFYGSSKSSHDKTALLDEQAKQSNKETK